MKNHVTMTYSLFFFLLWLFMNVQVIYSQFSALSNIFTWKIWLVQRIKQQLSTLRGSRSGRNVSIAFLSMEGLSLHLKDRLYTSWPNKWEVGKKTMDREHKWSNENDIELVWWGGKKGCEWLGEILNKIKCQLVNQGTQQMTWQACCK